jgi:tetratricopeptide (TPR) repeat protein
VESIIPWQQQRATYIALAICILLALVVIFVLPSLIKPPETTPVVIGGEASPTQALQESRFRDAQLAKARRESQDSLGQLLEKQKFLEKRNIQLWNKSAFETALKHASEGDLLYRQRDFPAALVAYQTALNQLSDLEQRIPEELSNNLKKGDEAFTQGQAKEAKQYYELAQAIDASSAQAKTGLVRTAALDNVLAFIAQETIFLKKIPRVIKNSKKLKAIFNKLWP